MKKRFWLVCLTALACAGGSERIDLTNGRAGEDLYVHSPEAPRVALEPAAASDHPPDLPEGGRLWTGRLPVGVVEAERPAVRLATAADGKPLDGFLRIDRLGTGDFRSADPIPLREDDESPGYYWTDPFAVSFSIGAGGAGGGGSASFKGLVRLDGEGGWMRLYPEETRLGAFPGGGPGFLLYDADRNGIYDSSDRLVIDANRDGVFDGNRNSVELYRAADPFLVNGRAGRIGAIAPDGSFLTVEASDEVLEPRVALAAGDPAPDFVLAGLQGESVRFGAASRGRPTLLAYWATW